MASKDSASLQGVPPFPGEKPNKHMIVSWCKQFKEAMPSSFSAAFAKQTPAFMLDYVEYPMDSIPLIFQDAAAGITFRDVHAQDR